MRGRIAVVMTAVVTTIAGCSGTAQPVTQEPVVMRKSVPRNELPAEIQPLVPLHGVYLAGGGSSSTVFRVVVDTDAKTIYTGTSPAGTPLHGTLAEERTRELTPANEQHLMKLCADAWTEPAPASPSDPVEGYDEILVVADNAELFFLHEQGPITRPAAVKAIEALRAAAALN
jgi:hypothetical protein